MNSEMVSWLVTCPCSDGNFKYRIKEATADEIVNALREVRAKGGAKSKIKVLETALRKRGYMVTENFVIGCETRAGK